MGCIGLTSLDISNFNTNNVVYMSEIFNGCEKLQKINLGNNFKTNNVVDMSNMFQNTAISSIDLSIFDTSNVKIMTSMFKSCSQLTSLDLKSFRTINAIYV